MENIYVDLCSIGKGFFGWDRGVQGGLANLRILYESISSQGLKKKRVNSKGCYCGYTKTFWARGGCIWI